MQRKGFTLIELIVVMSIISILILLGSPKYKAYSEQARLTRLKVNIKELENASNKYYMSYNEWPRMSDTPYTSEEIEVFSKQVLDKTGMVLVLESDGNYYDLDYDKISNYIKKPNDSLNYILQNPVGHIYYIDGLTDEGKSRVPTKELNMQEVVWNEDDKHPTIILSEGGLKAANPDRNVHGSVKSTLGKSQGKWYWEVKVLSGTHSYASVSVGVSDSSEKGLNEGYNSPKSVRYYQSSSVFIASGNSIVEKPHIIMANDVLGLLLDMDNKTIEFRRNDSPLVKIDISPYISSEAYALLELCESAAVTNFGSSPFLYSLPEGYKPYAAKQVKMGC